MTSKQDDVVELARAGRTSLASEFWACSPFLETQQEMVAAAVLLHCEQQFKRVKGHASIDEALRLSSSSLRWVRSFF